MTIDLRPIRGRLTMGRLNAEVERIEADGQARAYARRFYEPIGTLHGPLVTLHKTLDEVVPFHMRRSIGSSWPKNAKALS